MSRNRLFAMVASAAVVVAVLAGLFLAGSPADERLRRLDEIRISNLRNLNAAIDAYIRRNNFMPRDLVSVVDGRQLMELPVDPESGAQYDFVQIDSGSYQLCASFSAAYSGEVELSFWAHPAGRSCFTFQVSTDTVLQ